MGALHPESRKPDVFRQKLHAFQPIGFTIASDLAGNDDRQADGHHLGWAENQIDGMRANEVTGQHQHRRNE